MMRPVGRVLANPVVVCCAALAFAGCAADASPEVQAELTALDQQAADGIGTVEHALADPEFRSLGDGVRKVESAIRRLGVLETDPVASDAQRFQAMLTGARAWDELARAFEHAADGGDVAASQTLRDKAMPARFLASSGYARAYEFACSQGLTDQPLFIESGAACPE